MQFIKANPREYSDERNDCTVRATSLALNKPYKEIHKVYSDNGRKWGKGCDGFTIERVIKHYVGSNYNKRSATVHGRITLARFLKDYPQGHWIVVRRGHAFAVIDGVAHDADISCCGSRCVILLAYKVK